VEFQFLKLSIYQNLPITKTLKHDFPTLHQTLLVTSPLIKITTCTRSDFWRLKKSGFYIVTNKLLHWCLHGSSNYQDHILQNIIHSCLRKLNPLDQHQEKGYLISCQLKKIASTSAFVIFSVIILKASQLDCSLRRQQCTSPIK